MKTKRKTFGSFFVRVGTGFLAFWLVLMGAFTLLLGQQRAQLMLSEMENKADFFDGNFGKYLLDSKELGTDDTAQLRRALRWQCFRIDSKDPPNVQIVETAITDKNGDVLQSNRWWLTVRDGDTDYDVDMGDQPQKVCEAVLVGSAMTEELRSAPFPEMTFEAWVDEDQAYLKSVTVCPTKEVNGSWEPTGEVNTVECVYDESKVKNLPLKTMRWASLRCPGPSDLTAKQLAASLTSPARLALREWAENPSGANSSEAIVRPWLVRQYQRTMKYCDYVDGGNVMMSFAAEGYPLKACLPILVPAGAMSFTLAMLCAVILSFALLRVWRRQERVEQVRRETTAALAHELKTPLTSIMGYAEIIEAGIAKPTDVVPFAGKIRTEAQRLLSLIEDIIRLSQLDAGGEEIPFEPIELQPLCCTVRSRLQSKADRLGLKIECAGENATVSGQRRTLEQMVFNLADNALAYNRPNGSVTIETGTDSDGAPFVRVSDTGIGIAPADQKRVFERFYRVDKSHSKMTGGTGLGLSIVKHGAALHGAALTLDSTLNVGTRITLTFPKNKK